MPPKYKFEKQEIVQAGLSLVRRHGLDAVTARAVAAELNASSKVIFGYFESMDRLQEEILFAAYNLYQKNMQEEMAKGSYPMYKASGMAYIGFAQAEPQLFRLLFMRDRTTEAPEATGIDYTPILDMIQRSTGLPTDEAKLFHAEMWIFVHGIATMLATGFFLWNITEISDMLSDCYQGLRHRFENRKGEST